MPLRDNRMVGAPLILFKDTKANIEALTPSTAHNLQEGAFAYATDTDEIGFYDGAAWTWSDLTGSGGGAPVNAQYLTLDVNATLTAERVLALGAGLRGTDAGANGNYTVDLDPFAGLASYQLKLARQEATALNATSTVTLINYSGSGMVLTVWLATNASGTSIPLDSILKVYVDGEVSPSVETDLGSLGVHFLDPASSDHMIHGGKFETRHVGVARDQKPTHMTSFVFKFPIPFSTSIQIDLENPSGTSGTIWSQVIYTTDITNSRRLKSANLTYPNRATVNAAGTYDFLDLAAGNAGVIVWHSLVCVGNTDNLFMENDVNVYLDGEVTPSVSFTATEDYLMSSHYFMNAAENRPWMFCSVIDQTNHRLVAGLDLWELFGGIKFTDGVVVEWDASEMTGATSVDVSYLLLYYED